MKSITCIYCRKRTATERDHVPPKCLFPKPAPADLITVPCCSECNRSLSKDGEYFRAIISQLAETDQHPAAKKLLHEKILKGMERKPKLASKIMSTVIPVDLTYHGQHVATVAAYDIDNESFDRVMVKILKGLLYHETGNTVSLEFVVKWNVIHKPLELPAPLYERLMQSPLRNFGDQIFQYQVYIHPGTIGSFWLMCFYGGPVFHGGIFIEN